MAIWGHDQVHVEKVPERRCWIVSTTSNDPQKRQLLVEVKWEDAFKTFPHAPDYGEAVSTCQSHEDTMLTYEEEELVQDLIAERITRAEYEGKVEDEKPNRKVISMDDFRKKRER